ncbi:organic solute transporter Ostalpha-domain-containing protein [Catenaria anguillulae PL171]|uniref:Organic solute transporter Ostalpha-domain-containing protein n=1 Tax=Catenaria anguillulae PL171 TaxID=765915 RepID=A0A1Y2HD62_9FUNG|nr:organic solute transporter Ostalpha-domain-containing protein [Catenaria anguillulae PL171]
MPSSVIMHTPDSYTVPSVRGSAHFGIGPNAFTAFSERGQGWEKIGAVAYYVALVFTVLACLISFRSMTRHLLAYRRPHVQRQILRIFWMVPIYAISSLMSLRNKDAAEYIEAVRDLYEAFVLYLFFNLLVEYLGGERAIHSLLLGRAPTPHMFPVSLFSRSWDVANPRVFLSIKRGILQFVVFKPIFAALTLALKRNDAFQEGFISLTSAYVWVSILYNISVSWSLYCLVIFFMTCVHDLRPFRPLPKFLCIKAVLFFSFWQGVVVSILVYARVIQESGDYSTDNISLALQDFLICVEMAAAAWAHEIAFSPTDYVPQHGLRCARLKFKFALRDALGIADIARDFVHTLQGTRFFALSAADNLLDQFGSHRRPQWWERVLSKAGYRRRFRGSLPVFTDSDHNSFLADEDAALLDNVDGDQEGYGAQSHTLAEIDFALDGQDEDLYQFVKSTIPQGDTCYPVLEDDVNPIDFVPPSTPTLLPHSHASFPISHPSPRRFSGRRASIEPVPHPYVVPLPSSSPVPSGAFIRQTVSPGPEPKVNNPL